jgi:hypothetical protein
METTILIAADFPSVRPEEAGACGFDMNLPTKSRPPTGANKEMGLAHVDNIGQLEQGSRFHLSSKEGVLGWRYSLACLMEAHRGPGPYVNVVANGAHPVIRSSICYRVSSTRSGDGLTTVALRSI